MDPSRLGPGERAEALRRLEGKHFDVLVVGGGVTGTGCALDAATRGVSVGLVEQRDFASGTSSRSSKLIHGGLRYLEQLRFGLVFEALRERSLMLDRLCPHLVRPVSFVYPMRHRIWERLYVGAGVLLYDGLASTRRNPLPRHRHLGRRAMQRLLPALRDDAYVGGVRYWDAQVDDARHTLALARTAAREGAVVATSVRVVGFLREDGRIIGVTARCLETGHEFPISASVVINAGGVWTDDLEELAGGEQIKIRPSKGIHIVVPRDRIDLRAGLILRTETSVLFVIPWDRHWLIGTTDTPWTLDQAHPAASRRDIDYLLEHLNRVLADPLQREDIVGVFAGLRPLLEGESDFTSRLSREHRVVRSAPGLVTVAGGKYTTYRVMARDAVDAAASGLNRPVAPSVTERVPLVGAEGFEELWSRRDDLARRSGLPPEQIERLLHRYGSRIEDLMEMIESERDLREPLRGGGTYLAVEIRYGACHEGALHLDDVLARRTRISIEMPDRGLAAAEQAAEIMAGVLEWDRHTVDRELWHYRARIEAERDSQEQPDDRTADAARLGAPDVRRGAAH
jgi:glycerol-3-phosphate dehydrogenase